MIKKATNVQYSYIISGNGIQNGNPSPSNILPFDGCGDKTENLFSSIWEQGSINGTDGQNVVEGTIVRTKDYIPITPNKAYSFSRDIFNGYMNVRLYRTDKSYIGIGSTSTIRLISGTTTGNPMGNNTSFCCFEVIDSEAAYIRFNDSSNNTATKWLMVEGEYTPQTIPEYEPYSYKISISSSGENLFPLDENKLHVGRIENDGTIDYQIGTITVGTNSITYQSTQTWRGFYTDFIRVNENEKLTFSPIKSSVISWACCCYDENDTFLGKASAQTIASIRTFILLTGTKKVRMSVTSSDTTYTILQPMLNVGSTALSYKPYIEPVEANIYLGQVETTRNIKKLVLTGAETPYKNSSSSTNYLYYFDRRIIMPDSDSTPPIVCNQLEVRTSAPVTEIGINSNNNFNVIYVNFGADIMNAQTSGNTTAGLKEYLQQQYTAGTPVTVWYVLTTPEVSIVNEPLMKIGNYVDTINNTQSGIDITTNNLTVNTTIPPSDISINTTATWVPIPYNKYNTETISTIAPIDFLSNGQNITVGVKGNVEQLEIPSPDNPVLPEGTGERTRNLFDKTFASGYNISANGNPTAYQDDSRCATLEPIDVSNENNVTFSFVNTASDTKNFIYSLFNGSSLVTRVAGGQSGDTIDVSQGNKLYICVYSNLASVNAVETTINIMLNSGSSALTYEPYGYKITISSNEENLAAANKDYNSAVTGLSVEWEKGSSEMLINGKSTSANSITFATLALDTGTYTLSITGLDEIATNKTGFYLSPVDTVRVQTVRTYTITEPTIVKLQFVINSSEISYENRKVTIMFTKTSTPLPYEPHNHATTPVYLGEVQSTRSIRKLVLTGDEDWELQPGSTADYFRISNMDAQPSKVFCTHYISPDGNISYANTLTGIKMQQSQTYGIILACRPPNVTGLSNFKSYLAQQYAAGTPATVWYVLATPTTGIVNEPLMRIDDYADEVSNITVPTTKGFNTLSVNTSVQPSNVQLSISGWVPHNNIKEYKNNAWMATSWEGFRDIVRAGNGPTRYPIGTKLYETWGDNTSNAIIIAGYNDFFDPDITAQGYTNSVTLISEKFIPSMSFDAVEAMMYVTAEMPPGTYKFTIPNYDAPYGGDKTYYFETTKVVPVGGHICLEWRYHTVPRTIRTYASATSTTVLDSYGTQANPLPEWDSSITAIDLGTISMGTSVTTGTYGIFNHIHRARYGSNNYYQSKLRQYMNSGASAGNWWKPMTIFDRPTDFYGSGPNPASVAGYLSTINSDFKSVLAAPSIPCMTNNTFEVGTIAGTPFARQTAYNVRDKVFLLSHTEVNLSSSPTVGSTLALYTNATDADRIKYNKNTGDVGTWWLRVPYPSYAHTFRCVVSSGALADGTTYVGYGMAPAYTIQ